MAVYGYSRYFEHRLPTLALTPIADMNRAEVSFGRFSSAMAPGAGGQDGSPIRRE